MTKPFYCPVCNHKMKGRTDADEHETYITVKCTYCKYTVSPSHDCEIVVLEFERYNNIPHTWNLKVAKKYFEAILDGSKTFEFRLNDRDYQVGDILWLREFEAPNKYFRSTNRIISYIVKADEVNFWSEFNFEGFIILGLHPEKTKYDICCWNCKMWVVPLKLKDENRGICPKCELYLIREKNVELPESNIPTILPEVKKTCPGCELSKPIDELEYEYNKKKYCDDCNSEILYCEKCKKVFWKDDLQSNCECGNDLKHDCKEDWWMCTSDESPNCDDYAKGEAEQAAISDYEMRNYNPDEEYQRKSEGLFY